MPASENQEKGGILFVDDEEKALKYFDMAFKEGYRIFIADKPAGGFEILSKSNLDIHIVISDQRMPEMQGVDFLSRVRALYPNKVRILTTAYSDLDSAIRSVNEGHIYQYVIKPWDIQEFEMVLKRAYDYARVINERDRLLGLKMLALQKIILSDRIKTLTILGTVEVPQRISLLRASTIFVNTMQSQFLEIMDNQDTAYAEKEIAELLIQERNAYQRIFGYINTATTDSGECLSHFIRSLSEHVDKLEGISIEVAQSSNSINISVTTEQQGWVHLIHSVFSVLTSPTPPAFSCKLFVCLGLPNPDLDEIVFRKIGSDNGDSQIAFKLNAGSMDEPEIGLSKLYNEWYASRIEY